MDDLSSPLGWLREFGSLGLLGYVVYWLLRKFNGKLDRLTDAVDLASNRNDTLEKAIRANTSANLKLTRKFVERETARH